MKPVKFFQIFIGIPAIAAYVYTVVRLYKNMKD